MNIICLILDRINIRFAGPYGNASDLTPGLDQLASDSVVFDWYFTNSLDLREIYRHFWFEPAKPISAQQTSTSVSPVADNKSDSSSMVQNSGKRSLPELFGEKNYETVLLTDEPVLSNLADDHLFKEMVFRADETADLFSKENDETHLFQMFSELGTQINRLRKGEKPFFIWSHLKGLGGIWDFPLYCDEENNDDIDDNDNNNNSDNNKNNIDNLIDIKNSDSSKERFERSCPENKNDLSDFCFDRNAVKFDDNENNSDENNSEDDNGICGHNIGNDRENDQNDDSDDSNSDKICENNRNNDDRKFHRSPSGDNELYEEKTGINGLPFYKIKSGFSGRWGKVFPEELKKKWNDIYEEGIRHLDSLLAGLLVFLEEEKILDDTLFVLAGSRGLPLGEHSQLGLSNEESEAIYFESVHQPLVIRFPDRRFETVRVQGICSPSDLYETIREIANENLKDGLFPLMEESVKEIHSNLVINQKGTDSKSKAVVTPNWYLIQSENEKETIENLSHNETSGADENWNQTQYFGESARMRYELYTCPQDRWNVNDVSDRCEETVDELSKILEEQQK